LTEAGLALEPVALELGTWGARYLGRRSTDELLVPTPLFLAMRAGFNTESAARLHETYELHVDNRVFEVRIDNGRCSTREGGATSPSVVLSLDVETLYDLLTGAQTATKALEAGRVVIARGEREALDRFIELFAFDRLRAA
jgi:putative sterol carrier protein